MAAYDLTYTLMKSLDRHQILPLLEFLGEKKLYKTKDMMQAKLELVSKTKMVDFAAEEYKKAHNTTTIPDEMEEQKQRVHVQLSEWKDACGPLLNILNHKERPDDDREKSLMDDPRETPNFKLEFLRDVTKEHVDNLFRYAKLNYDCGAYKDAAAYLYYFRLLSDNDEKRFWALWGKLAAEILMVNFTVANEDLKELADLIDKRPSTHMEQLQQRTWLIHWSLFIFFNRKDQGREEMVQFFFQDKMLNTIQTNCPHILRYLTTAVVINHRLQKQQGHNDKTKLDELRKVLQQEQDTYSDPITDFIRVLFVEFDFDAAHVLLKECQTVLSNDFFLMYEKDEFLKACRLLIFETYAKIHKCIDINELATKLNLEASDVEPEIVKLIQEAQVVAKIDSGRNQLIVGTSFSPVYQQVQDKTKTLNQRSAELFGKIEQKYESFARAD